MNSIRSVALYFIIILYSILFVSELVANQLTHSLTLLIDCYHNLYTTMSLILLVIGYKISNESTLKNTFGWARIEVLGALFNMIFFAALCFSVTVEGIQSLAHTAHEATKPSYPRLLIFGGGIGFFLHIISYLVVGVHSIAKCGRPVVHVIRDFSSTFTLITAYFVITFSDHYIKDRADSVFGIVAVIILFSTMSSSMKESALILLQTAPRTIDIHTLKKSILQEFPSILNIHDLHVWSLTSTKIIATCHISLPSQTTDNYLKLTTKMKAFLAEKGISLATIQPEFSDISCRHNTANKCLYICDDECESKTCCTEYDPEEEKGSEINEVL
ncbi:Zinc/cadmium resistance protein-like protein [Dinothrombium tinctorium]|uniref:Zinc/cadmium resistance protein-like protein n=1 Tax=Dinothrombium tinctorium TaxID=1965070 RepID=A0A3S3Q3Z0_9ACAR|nr:Zinc/cadmium resistance protein-like protein [Dinothrombium tinctorium]